MAPAASGRITVDRQYSCLLAEMPANMVAESFNVPIGLLKIGYCTRPVYPRDVIKPSFYWLERGELIQFPKHLGKFVQCRYRAANKIEPSARFATFIQSPEVICGFAGYFDSEVLE
jgi:hypothetical protein